jgi:tripartite-type tricarboxylate transporter receptor subunit TctC
MMSRPAAMGAVLLSAVIGATVAAAPRAYADVNKVMITVGFSPGGGNDVYARLLARHLKKHLPGDTSVLVRNLPGSGSLKAVQSLQFESSNEINVVTFNYGLITESQVKPDRIKLRLSDAAWIGSMTSVLPLCFAWHSTGVKSWADVMKKSRFATGAPAIGSSNYLYGAILKNILKGPVQIVTGYAGSAEERIAIERGELDGGCGALSSLPPHWIEQKLIVPLLTFSADDPDLAKAGIKVPFVRDMVSSPEEKQLLDMLIRPAALGRPFIVSSKVDPKNQAILRTGFDATMKDFDMLAEAKKLGLPIEPISGHAAQKMVEEIYAIPQSVVDRAREILQ